MSGVWRYNSQPTNIGILGLIEKEACDNHQSNTHGMAVDIKMLVSSDQKLALGKLVLDEKNQSLDIY